jgi:hypothetical protein
MSRRVQIAPGLHQITLPDGNEYEGGDEVVLTNEQFGRIARSALGDEIIDLGSVVDTAGTPDLADVSLETISLTSTGGDGIVIAAQGDGSTLALSAPVQAQIDSAEIMLQSASEGGVINIRANSAINFREGLLEKTLADLAAPSAPVAGTPIVRMFPFAFDTPDLLTGAAVYTPTIGDILLDAWVQIDVAFDGETPHIDVGSFTNDTHGWWYLLDGAALDATLADLSFADGLQSGPNIPGSASLLISAIVGDIQGGNQTSRPLPAKFTDSLPIMVCLSKDGQNYTEGNDPGCTQGSGVLYLVIVTPLAL